MQETKEKSKEEKEVSLIQKFTGWIVNPARPHLVFFL
jgi:hypothetical protein